MSAPARPVPAAPKPEAGDPLATLSRVSGRVVAWRSALAASPLAGPLRDAMAWLSGPLGTDLEIGRFEVIEGARGLSRTGVVAHLARPSLAARLGLGLDVPLAHALVDRLLGSGRPPGESGAPVSPLEWGLLRFAIGRCVDFLNDADGAPEWVLDRVTGEPFDPDGLGRVVTLRSTVRVADVTGSAWIWMPESAAWHDLGREPRPTGSQPAVDPSLITRLGSLAGTWRAEAGTVTLARGPSSLRVGGIVPIDGAPMGGTPASPSGPVSLGLRTERGRAWFPTRCAPLSSGGRLILDGPQRSEALPREPRPMSMPDRSEPPADPSSESRGRPTPTASPEAAGQGTAEAPPSPAGIPVTMVVELGRVNLTVERVASLKAGDVIELNRHSREPVELTSGGKLVARGELVLIDTELGVRVTSVFL